MGDAPNGMGVRKMTDLWMESMGDGDPSFEELFSVPREDVMELFLGGKGYRVVLNELACDISLKSCRSNRFF